jgi:hypothetical protein
MGQITITFSGICSHFRLDPVKVTDLPVAHRVVLPRAAHFRLGVLRAQKAFPLRSYFTQYYLQPHFGFLSVDGCPPEKMTYDPITNKGLINLGCAITVDKVTDPPVTNSTYSKCYQNIPRLGDYVTDYAYSKEVVLGGRAVCYFDVSAAALIGTNQDANGCPANDGSLYQVIMTINTDGPPRLTLTPFDTTVQAQVLDFGQIMPGAESISMTVFNAEIPQTDGTEDTPYDFLLHYETSTIGLESQLIKAIPGLTDDIIVNNPWNPTVAQTALGNLGDALVAITQGTAPGKTALNVSCSNSQFP